MKTLRPTAALDSTHGIDLAPMLDFVMNLLIFFIITAIFIREAGIEVARPTVLDGAVAAPNIQIVVTEAGDVYFNGRPVDVRAVRANIEREKAQYAGSEIGVIVMANNQTATGALLGVIDQVRLGGVEDITFMAGQ